MERESPEELAGAVEQAELVVVSEREFLGQKMLERKYLDDPATLVVPAGADCEEDFLR